MNKVEFIKNLITKYASYLTNDPAAKKLLGSGNLTARYFIRAFDPTKFSQLDTDEIEALFSYLMEERPFISQDVYEKRFGPFIKFYEGWKANPPSPPPQTSDIDEEIIKWYSEELKKSYDEFRKSIAYIIPDIDWTGFDEFVESNIKQATEKMKTDKNFYEQIKKMYEEMKKTKQPEQPEQTEPLIFPTRYVIAGDREKKTEKLPEKAKEVAPELTPVKQKEYPWTYTSSPEGKQWTQVESSADLVYPQQAYLWKGFPDVSKKEKSLLDLLRW